METPAHSPALDPLISCLCVSRQRPQFLQQAIACFKAQHYPHLEMVVVLDVADAPSRSVVRAAQDARIRAVVVADHAAQSLGQLRNWAVQMARGDWIAQWDDDDWHAPERLSAQWQALRGSGRSACVLWQVLLHDAERDAWFLSGARAWEPTLLAKKQALPAFAALSRGEDTPVLRSLYEQNQLLGLRYPRLYVYRWHGGNTWSAEHWQQRLLPAAERLSASEVAEMQLRMRSLPSATEALVSAPAV